MRALVDGRNKSGGNFEQFPWLGTFFPNRPRVIRLSVAQVNLLSNLTAWNIIESASEVARTLRLAAPP